MLYKRILLLSLAVLLGGCAVSNVSRDFSLKDNPDQGIIIASVSFDRLGSRNFQAIFDLDGQVDGSPAFGQRLQSLPEYATIRMGSQFKDSFGQVLAISLPAGRHTISSWRLVRSAGYIISPVHTMPPLEFQVEPGTIRYIGNFHLNLVPDKNLLGMSIIADAWPEVRDRSDRDLPLIKRKYPQFADRIETQLLPLGPWSADAPTSKAITPLILPPAK
jgi:hypothetical protein